MNGVKLGVLGLAMAGAATFAPTSASALATFSVDSVLALTLLPQTEDGSQVTSPGVTLTSLFATGAPTEITVPPPPADADHYQGAVTVTPTFVTPTAAPVGLGLLQAGVSGFAGGGAGSIALAAVDDMVAAVTLQSQADATVVFQLSMVRDLATNLYASGDSAGASVSVVYEEDGEVSEPPAGLEDAELSTFIAGTTETGAFPLIEEFWIDVVGGETKTFAFLLTNNGFASDGDKRVPVPATLPLMALALAGLGYASRRRKAG